MDFRFRMMEDGLEFGPVAKILSETEHDIEVPKIEGGKFLFQYVDDELRIFFVYHVGQFFRVVAKEEKT